MTGLDSRVARARMQAAFVGGVVAPLWRAVAALAPGGALDEPLRNVEANALYYAGERDSVAQAGAAAGGAVKRALLLGMLF